MKIVLASMAVKSKDIIGNLNTISDSINDCRQKAYLIVFCEAFLQGFDCLCWNCELDKKVAIYLYDEALKRIQESAKKFNSVSFGFIERKDECLYSF